MIFMGFRNHMLWFRPQDGEQVPGQCEQCTDKPVFFGVSPLDVHTRCHNHSPDMTQIPEGRIPYEEN